MIFNTFKAIGLSIVFYLLEILILIVCSSFTNNYVIYSLISALIIILIIFFVFKKDLIKKFKEIKKDFNLKIFLIGILGIIITIIIDRIFIHFIGQDSSNNTAIIKLLKSYPLLMGINVVLITPLKEELIYRFPYKNTNPLIGLIISSTIFAFVHIQSFSEIIYIIPYLIMAFSIGINYFKTNNNVYISYLLHSLNNLINVLLLIW